MGTPVTTIPIAGQPRIDAKLGYSQWQIYADRIRCGRVILNSLNGSALFTPEGENTAIAEFLSLRTFEWWVKWINLHLIDSF